MSGNAAPWECLPPLKAIAGLRHGFVTRVPGLCVDTTDKAEALERLRIYHEAALKEIGLAGWPVVSAEQVHGREVVVLPGQGVETPAGAPIAGVDGLVTNRPGVALAIYVADCAAVFLVDPVRRVAGLVHSGRKGTELGITRRAIGLMTGKFQSSPGDLVAVLSPCIRPPAYEIDFAAAIREQCREAGIPEGSVHDAGICTSSDRERFYSYRVEKGRTGRMLAVLGWEP